MGLINETYLNYTGVPLPFHTVSIIQDGTKYNSLVVFLMYIDIHNFCEHINLTQDRNQILINIQH